MINVLPSENIENSYGKWRGMLVIDESGRLAWFDDFHTDEEDYYFKLYYPNCDVVYFSCVGSIVGLDCLPDELYAELAQKFAYSNIHPSTILLHKNEFNYLEYRRILETLDIKPILTLEDYNKAKEWLEKPTKFKSIEHDKVDGIIKILMIYFENKTLPYVSSFACQNLERLMVLRNITSEELVGSGVLKSDDRLNEILLYDRDSKRLNEDEISKLAAYFKVSEDYFNQR